MRQKGERVDNWKDGLLRCSKCEEYKTSDQFGSDKRNKFREFKANQCKNCSKLRSRIVLKSYSENGNLSFYLMRLLSGIKDRTLKNKMECDLDKSYLLELYKSQNGKCSISGIPMTYITGKKRNIIHENISVDRIFPEKGYIKGNIQLCCTIINIMKYDLSIEKLVEYCKTIIKWQK